MRRRQNRSRSGGNSPTGRLRIVAGKWRSRLLPVSGEPDLRPTAERIRETLFNWLANDVEGARCLDLFAGTGALGFEALSRGAREAVFVESSAEAMNSLQASAATLGAAGASFHSGDAFEFLRHSDGRFDLVFLDPPFACDVLEDLCRLLDSGDWLTRGARVYIEQDRKRPLPALPDGWNVLKEKTAGGVRYALASGADK